MDSMYRYGDLLAWTPALAFLLVVALVSFSRIFERNAATLGLLVAVLFWIWADLTHGFVSDPGLKSLLFHLQFAFLACIPLTWIGTCFRLAGYRGPVKTWTEVGLGLAALVFWGLLATDDQIHGFFSALVLPADSWTFYRQNGPGYYAFITLVFSSLVVGLVILARSRPYFSFLDLKRSTLILWGISIPTVAGLIDVFKLLPVSHFVLVPGSIMLTALFFLYSILWGRLFTPTPMAYEIVVQRMPDPVVVMDSTQRPIWLNEAAKALWPGVTTNRGSRLEEVFPSLAEHLATLREAGEITLSRGDRQYRVQGAPAQDQRSGFEAMAFVFHDITGLKAEQNRLEALVGERTALLHEVNRRLEAELAKRELLLREVNHRVKNNLQIILSLIKLQTRRLPAGSDTAEVLAATQARIRSIALVHDLIYRTDFVNGLDFRVYLEELVEGIRDLYDQPGVGVEVRVGTQNLQVGVDFSVDFGLIVNELVTNALKHGLLPAGGGVVAVEANLVEGSLVLTVRDPGPGYPQGASEGTSLGLGIVRSVLKKYGADLLFLVEGGSRVEVRVPWSGHRAAAT